MTTIKKVLQRLEEAKAGLSAKAHYAQVMSKFRGTRIDPDEYPPIPGMEGPFGFRSGKILYYDPKAGRYYDRKTDMYQDRDVDPMQESTLWEPSQLNEGIYDPYILKCIFLAGGGGSGKGFISELMFGTVKDMATTTWGIKSLNSDNAVTALTGNLDVQAGRGGLGGRSQREMNPEFFASKEGIATRDKAKEMTKIRSANFVAGRLGVIIDGTADDPAKIKRIKDDYEEAGYDCSMVFVNTQLAVALQRNSLRMRKVPEEIVREAHAKVQDGARKFRRMFGNHTLLTKETYKGAKFPGMVEVDNSVSVTDEQVKTKLSSLLWKVAKKALEAPLKNPIGYQWLEAQAAELDPIARSKITWLGKKK